MLRVGVRLVVLVGVIAAIAGVDRGRRSGRDALRKHTNHQRERGVVVYHFSGGPRVLYIREAVEFVAGCLFYPFFLPSLSKICSYEHVLT